MFEKEESYLKNGYQITLNVSNNIPNAVLLFEQDNVLTYIKSLLPFAHKVIHEYQNIAKRLKEEKCWMTIFFFKQEYTILLITEEFIYENKFVPRKITKITNHNLQDTFLKCDQLLQNERGKII